MLGSEDGSWKAWLLLLPVAAVYAATFVVPLGLIFGLSLAEFDAGVVTPGFDLSNYEAALTDGLTLPILWRTVELAAMVTIGAAVMGYPVALQMRRSGPVLRTVILALIVAPLLTSVIVRNVAWLLVLGRTGFINETLMATGLISRPLPLMYNNFGVALATLHVYLTFAALPIYAALVSIDRRIEESAASLGASPSAVFWRVTFPLSRSGLIAGCSLVFILSMGLYLTPAIMGGSFVVTTPMLITDLARNQYNWPLASAVSVLLLLAIGLILMATMSLQRRRG
ncbi:MAG: ABC transporter permease [Paracoccaceae bacterium]|nr:ABC transporter permease [Paracoccaceae bacterium]